MKHKYNIIDVIKNNDGTTDWILEDIDTKEQCKFTNVYPTYSIDKQVYSDYSIDEINKGRFISVTFKGVSKNV